MIVRQAPAKVNLWLKICGKRSDGYHELDTLFAPLDLVDTVTLEKLPSGIQLQLTGAEVEIPHGPKNLAWQAAHRFFEVAGITEGVSIRLEKRIPSGAGLGGGSSDAAAVLIGLRTMYPDAISGKQLHVIAAQIGSDVPFFLLNSAARGRGRGEILKSVPSPWCGSVLLCKPPFGISTPWAYREYSSLCAAGEITTNASAPQLWQNDLEIPVFRKYPILALLKSWLISQEGVLSAMMCGSGSTMLAALESPNPAPIIQKELIQEFGSSFFVQISRIPERLLEIVGQAGPEQPI